MPALANIAKINGIVISGAPAVSDTHTLIATATASSSATLAFTSGIDSTYDAYEFHMVNIHAGTDEDIFGFQFNADGASGFNEAIVSTFFRAENAESGGSPNVAYSTYHDQATTDGNGIYQHLAYTMQTDNDEAFSGILTLYAPADTTYVKHFVAKGNYVHHSGKYSQNTFVAGYVNTTSAIDEISFAMASGNIDAGTIHMYGVG